MDLEGETKQYFCPGEWARLSAYEKNVMKNILQNYYMLRSLGVDPQKPAFMQKKQRPSRRSDAGSPASDSNEDQLDNTAHTATKKSKCSSSSTAKTGSKDDEDDKEWVPLCAKIRQVKFASAVRDGSSGGKQPSASDSCKSVSAGKAPRLQDVKPGVKIDISQGFKVCEIRNSNSQPTNYTSQEFSGFTVSEQDYQGLLSYNDETGEYVPLVDSSLTKEQLGKRYPSRKKEIISYYEEPVPEDDDYIFCDDCNQEWEGDCPVHGALVHVPDTQVSDTDLDRAEKSAPACIAIADSSIPGAGKGAWTKTRLEKGLMFGPYKGAICETNTRSGYGWQLKSSSGLLHFVDAWDRRVSNWMRYVNCARYEEEQNMIAFQYKQKIFYRTFKDVPTHTELLVWYGDEYGTDLGINKKDFLHADGRLVKNETFQCEDCNVAFSSPLHFDSHKLCCRKKTCSEKKPFECTQCRASFKQRGHLMTHVRIHTGEKPFKCTHCGACFSNSSNLMTHVRIHTGEKPFKCTHCGACFSNSSNLMTHVRIHTGEKPFKCTHCGACFSDRSALTRHIRIHTGEKPFKCTHCGACFSNSSDLTKHIRIHTGEKPFKCTHCGACFSDRSALTRHIRIHTGEKPFKCTHCGASFSDSSNLMTHVRIHTGEKPFKCTHCGACFTQSKNLTKHTRTHSREVI